MHYSKRNKLELSLAKRGWTYSLLVSEEDSRDQGTPFCCGIVCVS